MDALKIDTSDLGYLFTMLDEDNSGAIVIEEFVAGCMKLKGEAKSFDVQCLMHDSRRARRRMDAFIPQVQGQLHQILYRLEGCEAVALVDGRHLGDCDGAYAL